MGITAEKVAQQWKVAREAQDVFATESHRKALRRDRVGRVQGRDHALPDRRELPDLAAHESAGQHHTRGSSRRGAARGHHCPKCLAKLRPAFAANGSVTAGNSSQTSDGAGAVMLVSRGCAEALQPAAAGAIPRLRGGRRSAGDHGHRPEVRHPQGAQAGRAQAGRHRLDRAERGLRGAEPGGHPGPAVWIRRRSIRWAARSRSGIRSARPARSAPRRWCTACAAANRNTAWSPCASAPAWAPPGCSSRLPDRSRSLANRPTQIPNKRGQSRNIRV